ncbi:MAG: alpha-mannosidase [Alphaproteobacteria bacterium]
MTTRFFYNEVFAKRIKELAELRYQSLTDIEYFYAEDTADITPLPQPPQNLSDKKMHRGDIWQGRDRYIWLTQNIEMPQKVEGKKIIGVFDFGCTGGGHNSGFESLLLVDGKSYQSVDSNHKEALFSDDYAHEQVRLDFCLWSGLEGGGERQIQTHEFKRAAIGYLDEKTDNFYYLCKTILESTHTINDQQPEKYLMQTWLKTAFQMVDYTNIGSDAFYVSIHRANDWLEQIVADHERKIPVNVHAVGHTHIDLAWLWRIKHTREKAVRSFSTVDRLMQEYDDYVFFHSTPQLYDFVKADHPELYEKIKQHVKDGRWEVGGGMWVESDCNIPSGESLTRQFLYGTRFFEQEFGVRSDYLWLPDVFGYSWALPQILKQCDINTFYTTKISWNEHNQMPHDSFVWSGLDGSQVLVHFVTTPEPRTDTHHYTYNGIIEPDVVMGIWQAYRDKAINQDLLLAFGYGDGGGGPNRDMIETRRKIQEIPAMPNIDNMTIAEYNRKLHHNIFEDPHNGYIHSWDNELYLEYHRGTYTSQADVKKNNRKIELALRDMELLEAAQALSLGQWNDYPHAMLTTSWKTLLRNQFHDIIPGSSIREVYEDTLKEYEEVWADIEQHQKSNYIEHDDILIQNTGNFKHSGIFYLGDYQGTISYKDNILKQQPDANGCFYYIDDVPNMAVVSLKKQQQQPALSKAISQNFTYHNNGVSTPFYDLTWNGHGQLTQIFDKENNREVLAEGELGNVLEIFVDKPRKYDAWELEASYNDNKTQVTQLDAVEFKEVGQLFCDIAFSWTYNHSKIQQTLRVYAYDRRIDFITKVDWHEHDKLLKAGFIVDIQANSATYDIQYGNCQRPNHHSTSWDHAKFEVAAHQWADLSQNDYGIALLNDCKYGYDIYQNRMRISLLKSSRYPDFQADMGQHEFTYALLPHLGDWRMGSVVQKAWDLNSPLKQVTYITPILSDKSLISANKDNIVIDAVKKAEDQDAIIIRMHEAYGRTSAVKISSGLPLHSFQECNMLEKPIGDEVQSNNLKATFKPYEIKNFIIK